MATWIEDITDALKKLGGIAPLTEIYKEVKKIRPLPHPKSFDATIRGAIERNSSDSKAHTGTKDIFFSVHGLGAGIWGLRAYVPLTPLASDIGLLPLGSAEPSRNEQTIYRILRDTDLARKIKLMHRNKCQICAQTLIINNSSYSEAHHIIPLGAPHYGPDTPDNIIVVCPNCHVQLDYFSVEIDLEKINTIAGHEISTKSIRYHNEHMSTHNQPPLT